MGHRAAVDDTGSPAGPPPPPILSPIHDGLDVSMTSNITWFNPNHDTYYHTVSCRIYRVSISGEHFITCILNNITHNTVKIRPRKAGNYLNTDHLAGFRIMRLALFIQDSQEIERKRVPPFSEVIRGSGGIQ